MNSSSKRKKSRRSKSADFSILRCVGMRCDIDARLACSHDAETHRGNPDRYCAWSRVSILSTVKSYFSDAISGVVVTTTSKKDKKKKKKPMREPSQNSAGLSRSNQHQVQVQQPFNQQQISYSRGPSQGPLGPPGPSPSSGIQANPNQLSMPQLQDMAMRQQGQIEAQQQMLVAKEQRLKYLRQQDFKQNQVAAEYERLRRLREKVCSDTACANKFWTGI